jgi:thymidylate synthase
MNVEQIETWNEGSNLDSLIHRVSRFGERVESRYGPCLEILGGKFQCESGSLTIRQGINDALGWMEMFQLLAGVYAPEELKRVAPNADHSLFTPQMAYGPRVTDQVPSIIQALLHDPITRQAVLFVGGPSDGPTKNLPCTLTIQFLIRENLIHVVVSMRSWDLCRGLPYDIMMFSGLLEMIGRCVNIQAGTITVMAGSTHIYLDQIHKIPTLRNTRWGFNEEVPDTWNEAREWFNIELTNIRQKQLPRGIELLSFL